jgi:hypothetical protein
VEQRKEAKELASETLEQNQKQVIPMFHIQV